MAKFERKVAEVYAYLSRKSFPDQFTPAQRQNLKRYAINFRLIDEVLYRTADGKIRKVVSTQAQALELFHEAHALSHGGHSGMLKTRRTVNKRYFWPGMTQDIDRWVAACAGCRKTAVIGHVDPVLRSIKEVHKNFDLPRMLPMEKENGSTHMDYSNTQKLKEELLMKEKEVKMLKERLARLQEESISNSTLPVTQSSLTELPPLKTKTSLTNQDILRYSRQLVLPEIGVRGQLNLVNSSVLIVGCGGLGCPLAQYLAASGIGRLGLLDYDVVELSNLHRQVLHRENLQGMSKSFSVAAALKLLNSSVEYIPYHMDLNSKIALELVQQYDVIADCSDNVPTRYLINDACVLTEKPLVSASALRMEGQLTVYNYKGGPCYRCLFPTPPPAETVTNCADGGVLGVVPGVLGVMQALEILKILSGIGSSFSQFLMLFDAVEGQFRNIKLRPRKSDCAVCGENPSVKVLQDYEAFCGTSASDKCRFLNLLDPKERISPEEYKKIMDNQIPHVLLDVRPQTETDICHLPNSVHIPLKLLEEKNDQCFHLLRASMRQRNDSISQTAAYPVYVICKLGNDSQKAVQVLQRLSGKELDVLVAKDITGGLMAWAHKVDTTFPQY